MKRLIFLCLGLLFAAPATAQLTDADVAAVRKFVQDDQSYRPAAKADALRLVDKLPAYLAQPAKFELEVARIVALADNGHTAFFPAQWPLRYPRSTVRLALFADGLFVIAAPTEQSAALGKPVAKINGQDWRALRGAFAAYQGGTQQFRDQFLPFFLETPAIMAAAGFGGPPGGVEITLADGTKVATKSAPEMPEGDAALLGLSPLRVAKPLIAGKAPLFLERADQYYDFQLLPELSAAYIRIDAIGGDGLKPFLTDSLARLSAGTQRNIILDLRFNGGGDLNRGRDFAKALPALAKGGRVYVITSGRTFSAAISTAGYVKQAGGDRVLIVGEPVGDRLEFWAEGDIRKLPGNGAMMLVATERHNYMTGCQEKDCHGAIRRHPIRVASLEPDLPAPMSFEAFKAGRDPAMDAIAADVRRR